MKSIAILTMISALSAPGLARADSSIQVRLSAHVDPFCHIYPPQNKDIVVVGGEATIGQVREICNTPDGYEVSTAFTNVSAGELQVGDNAYAIDNEGMALRESNQPAVRDLTWRLQHARLASASLPVIMQVTITPR